MPPDYQWFRKPSCACESGRELVPDFASVGVADLTDQRGEISSNRMGSIAMRIMAT